MSAALSLLWRRIGTGGLFGRIIASFVGGGRFVFSAVGRGKEFVALPSVAAFVPTAGDFAAASDWGKVTGAAPARSSDSAVVARSDDGNYSAEPTKRSP